MKGNTTSHSHRTTIRRIFYGLLGNLEQTLLMKFFDITEKIMVELKAIVKLCDVHLA
jgi:hypothetical protein